MGKFEADLSIDGNFYHFASRLLRDEKKTSFFQPSLLEELDLFVFRSDHLLIPSNVFRTTPERNKRTPGDHIMACHTHVGAGVRCKVHVNITC